MSEVEDDNPFTANDLQMMLDEEACTSEQEGWEFLKRTSEGDEIWRKSVKSVPVDLIKGILKFPGIPPKDIEEMITNLEIRKKWEKRFSEIDVLEEYSNYRVIYWRMSMPLGISDRDIVQTVSMRRDKSQNFTYILHKNATHPDKPDIPGVVRAETIMSGTIIRPDKDDPNSSIVTLLLQNDAKGTLPTWFINTFACNSPIEWKQSLSQHYHKEFNKKE